ncbi:hypothetical protein [Spiroplasma chrysopicola]|uniref:Uncharacterized protein n=1 Tax=Spiroplasma chrysopicola DF-1 TaxID=1276227 RepID=R4UB47_9MOLU|nr:hypothetical protein [Spiroplasma chrysopicola]AGM25124.1 hypothetical protein SCHRY_v1c05460 [Spiroplasma chrysopicola DF-1]
MEENKQLNDRQLSKYLQKMISLKTIELKLINSNISELDVTNYLLQVILPDRKIIDVSEGAFYIFNIKINRIIEFMNNQKVMEKNISLEEFEDMFKK